MVCNNFKKGHCLRGKGNCTMEQGPGCRTRDFFIFTERGNAVEPGSTSLSWCLSPDTVEGPSGDLLGGGCVPIWRPGLGWLGKSSYFDLQLILSDREYEHPSLPDGWRYNHTQLDCSDHCLSANFRAGALRILSFCCKGQDFCNRYQGNGWKWKPR